MNVLAEILSSKIQAEIFRLLFGTSAEELHMREIERRSGYAIGTIQTEFKKLLRLDLVKKRKDGNRPYYRANREHLLYPDIRSLILKTIGLVDILKDALREDSNINIAFVFGSIACHEETAGSDGHRQTGSKETHWDAYYTRSAGIFFMKGSAISH